MISQKTLKMAHSNESGMARHYLTLYACVLGVEAKNVFEFGGGYSTVTILEALEETGGNLITCDPRSIEDMGIDNMGTPKNWEHLKMLSNKGLKKIPEDTMFDLVLHDGTHKRDEVRKDLKAIMPHVKKNGLILIHDTFHTEKRYDILSALKGVVKGKATLCYGYGLTITRQKKGAVSIDPKWKKAR